MINRCPKHGEPLEYSKLHDGFICPISVCNYWEDKDGQGYVRFKIHYDGSDVPKNIIQGEVIKDESTQTTINRPRQSGKATELKELQEKYTSYMDERRKDGSYED